MKFSENELKICALLQHSNGISGSGFLFGTSKKGLFFVTAKHMLFELNGNLVDRSSAVYVYTQDVGFDTRATITMDLQTLLDEKSLRFHETHDVAVIRLQISSPGELGKLSNGIVGQLNRSSGFANTRLWAMTDRQSLLYDGMKLAGDALLFGYPSSLGFEKTKQIDDQKPILRKGSVAQKNDGNKTIVLDCPAYFGNSGGPVLFNSEETNKISGVVSQLVPFVHKTFSKSYKYENIDIENSGYSIVEPMDFVFELIDKY